MLTGAWNRLPVSRKVGLAALVVAAVVGLVLVATWSSIPEYQPAFTDLKAEDGAAVVQYLRDNAISYRLTDGGTTVEVPANQVYEVRLALAGQGLPAHGAVGFELFDTVNIGMTDFVQQVDYQRALEGELARTIGSMVSIKSARVHIVIPQPTLFTEEEKPTTASVVLDLEAGQKLSREQVQAISHLVSSAVEGLTPDNLTIVDTNGNVLTDGSGASAAPTALTATQLDAKRTYEQDLERRLQSMLESVVGPGRALVGVTADMNFDQVQTDSELYKPGDQGNALRSAQLITETMLGNGGVPGGIPGAASNIPAAAPSYQSSVTGTTGSAYQRSESTINYEVSKSVSRVVSAAGQVKRLSISVMVDNITNTTTYSAIQPSVIAAAGVDFARGDVVSVSNVVFDRSFYADQATAIAAAEQRDFILRLAQWGAVAAALLVLFLVVRGIQRSLHPAQLAMQRVEISAPPGTSLPADARTVLLQEVGRREPGAVGEAAIRTIGPPTFDADAQAAAEKAQMVRQLQLMAKNRPETVAQIIQFWMQEDKK